MKRKVLLIYTGGTIGMVEEPKTGLLRPVDFEHIKKTLPELNRINAKIDTYSFEEPIDSSNMKPDVWIKLVGIIEENYDAFDGFVVLHGSDTMAYTASAVSFMIQNLTKPIVFTGSQLPIGIIRTDGKENLITAIEIAADYKDDKPRVPEVSLYFEYKLYRGNRTTKLSANLFDAFESFNFEYLAEAGVDINYNEDEIIEPDYDRRTEFNYNLENDIGILKLHPGISKKHVKHFFTSPQIKAIIIETFGAGNAPSYPWFLEELKEANDNGIVVANVSQCKSGSVNQNKYETGSGLTKAGVISGKDITMEAALGKLMFLLGNYLDLEVVKEKFQKNICGELTE